VTDWPSMKARRAHTFCRHRSCPGPAIVSLRRLRHSGPLTPL